MQSSLRVVYALYMKVALITGISGQEGSYLAELLLHKGYQVHGIVRSHSQGAQYVNLHHIRHLIHLHMGDLTDSCMLRNLLKDIQPHEVYNLAAQSHVHVSFQVPEYTCDINGMGVLRLLDAVMQQQAQGNQIRFYQAGTSEMFGKVCEIPQTELTPFRPRSPYGVSKVFAHYMTVNYRESYGIHATNGILFNHESPRRGPQFVTRKLTQSFARIRAGLQTHVELGNLDSLRDWGHAKDYVKAMWCMLQQPEPRDYVIATGIQHSVREFCERVAAYHGMQLMWQGEGVQEHAVCKQTNKTVIKVDPSLYRPADVHSLIGDYGQAKQHLDWQPEISFEQLVNEMCESDWRTINK